MALSAEKACLIFPAPRIWENCIKIKFTFLLFFGALEGFMKAFGLHIIHKEVWKWKFK